MRLIDADAINPYDVFKGESDFAKDIRSGIIDLIKLQPTVDPVMHGHWKENYNGMLERSECSVCGCLIIYGMDYEYCMNCGAKMDEDVYE